jgi:preprotein translocase subunit YajC
MKSTFLKGSYMRGSVALLAVFSSAMSVFAQSGDGMKKALGSPILMMVIMFAIVYFLMLRPQMKKQKDTQNMLNNIKKGDKVLTVAGIVGVVGNIKDNGSVMVKVADSMVLEFKKAAITAVLNDEKSSDEKEDKSAK